MITRQTITPAEEPSKAEQLMRVIEREEEANPLMIIQRLGGQGREARAERDAWTVLWQQLEHAGFICQDLVEPKRWFVTPIGRRALKGPFQDYLDQHLSHG